MKKNNQFINEPSVKKLPTSRNVIFQDIPEDYGNHFSLIKLRDFLSSPENGCARCKCIISELVIYPPRSQWRCLSPH
ncbi:MAG: hypothetical protein CMK54_03655 [Proteobacteria bacterium]|nr:hypothetical protein [Pseudomonadota bacterium]